mmetsp:Transcript_50642/g.117597  ORF Transcript_50642/g.117597 Transcript_50642/m.117597 type:complete len:202 (+) Transcript_50642:947-1552(+)
MAKAHRAVTAATSTATPRTTQTLWCLHGTRLWAQTSALWIRPSTSSRASSAQCCLRTSQSQRRARGLATSNPCWTRLQPAHRSCASRPGPCARGWRTRACSMTASLTFASPTMPRWPTRCKLRTSSRRKSTHVASLFSWAMGAARTPVASPSRLLPRRCGQRRTARSCCGPLRSAREFWAHSCTGHPLAKSSSARGPIPRA